MSEDTKYNGWTNYATWRVHLEIFDGTEDHWTAESARDYVMEILESDCGHGLCFDYACAFISDVNWHEIASHYEAPEEDEEEEDE